jgi:hypothetical protein
MTYQVDISNYIATRQFFASPAPDSIRRSMTMSAEPTTYVSTNYALKLIPVDGLFFSLVAISFGISLLMVSATVEHELANIIVFACGLIFALCGVVYPAVIVRRARKRLPSVR